MAKSYLTTRRLTRQEKKKLHRENPNCVYRRGRAKYNSLPYRIALTVRAVNTCKTVDWSDVVSKPELYIPSSSAHLHHTEVNDGTE